MKQLLSFIFLQLAVLLGSAQIEPIDGYIDALEWGQSFDIPRDEVIYDLTSLRDGTPLMVSSDNDHLYIRKIDSLSLIPGASITLTDTEDKKMYDFFLRGDSLFTLIRAGKKSTGYSHELVVYRLTDQLQGEVYRRDVSLNIPGNEKSSQDIFFSVSENGKFAAVARQTGFLAKGFATFFVSITNAEAGVENHYELPTQIAGDDLETLGMAVGENGLVYMICMAGVQLNSPFRKKYLVYVFNEENKTLHEFDFATQEIFTKEMVLRTDPHGMQVASLYSTDPLNEDGVNGYTFIQFDSIGDEINQRGIHGFRSEMVQKHKLGDEQITGNEVKHLFLNNILMCGKTPFIVFEKQYKDQICQTDPRTGVITCNDQFHYDGVTFENLGEEGQSFTLPRKQIDYDYQGNYSSHQTLVIDNHLVIFYNDHYKNEGFSNNKIMNNPSRSVFRLAIIDELGNAETKKLTEDRQSDYAFMSSIKPVHVKDQIIVMASNGRGYKFGRLPVSSILK